MCFSNAVWDSTLHVVIGMYSIFLQKVAIKPWGVQCNVFPLSTGWVYACVSLSATVPFNRPFVCVGVGPALVELSITQCCWLLELISPSLCFCLVFMSCRLYIHISQIVCLICFMHLLIFCSLLFASLLIIHITLSPSLILSLFSFDSSLWISGRVWLWFRNQSQASWFHVVSHLRSQCLVCHIHILLQGKNVINRDKHVGH